MSVPARRGRRSLRFAPIGLMAAICMLMIAGCEIMPRPVIHVAPDPDTFTRVYGDDLVLAGEVIARERCVSCHGVEEPGRAGAPPLNTVVTRRGADKLADDLVAGLEVAHRSMPRFDFNVTAEVALMAYLEAIAVADTTGP